MKNLIGRIISWAATACFWVLVGVRTMLDLIGYSTIPDDAKIALGRLDDFFLWLLSVPWWGVFGFALVASMWLMWVSWQPSTRPSPSRNDRKDRAPISSGTTELKLVENVNFSNETRLLDGFFYRNCNFHNVQFTFNGGDYSVEGGTITGVVGIQSSSNPVTAAYHLLLFLQTYKRTIPDNTKIAQDQFGNIQVTIDMSKDPTFINTLAKEPSKVH